jgi:HTH-type transcriptional regulator / antitoxin HigA
MKIAPIKSELDYDAALADIDRLMDAEPNTSRGDRLDVLVTLVEAYEAKRWVIDPRPDRCNQASHGTARAHSA